jgi:hypothetical protein
MTSSADSTMLDDIWGSIDEELKKSSKNHWEQFLTRSSLEPLLKLQTVQTILQEQTCRKLLGRDVSIPGLADFVVKRALLVFAILIRMNKPYLIKSFNRDDFDESMLPIKYTGPKSAWSVESCVDKAHNTVLREIFCQNVWKYYDVGGFCDTHQWLFLPQVFTEERFRYKISRDMRLPYTRPVEDSKTNDSNYSRVEKRSIYRECFNSRIVRTPFSTYPVSFLLCHVTNALTCNSKPL